MRVAVLLGGDSEERAVSIASAASVVAALRDRGHEVLAVDTATGALDAAEEQRVLGAGSIADQPDGAALATLRTGAPALRLPQEVRGADVVFLALHGGSGEDGRLQAVLELAGIPFTGSGSTASGVAMDKDLSKRLARSAGVRTADWLTGAPTADEAGAALGWPLVVKPVAQGSSVGVHVVRDPADYDAAFTDASRYGEVMAEAYVAGREFGSPILADAALPVGEILLLSSDVFDYAAKYQGGAREQYPADVEPETAAAIQAASLTMHRVLKLGGYSRSDFRLDAEGRVWFMEANSLPGLTSESQLPQAARAVDMSMGELCERICELAVRPV